MKMYTEKEVEELIRKATSITMKQTMDWVIKETDIVHKTTKEISNEHQLDVRKERKSLLKDYIAPALKEQGIEWTFKN